MHLVQSRTPELTIETFEELVLVSRAAEESYGQDSEIAQRLNDGIQNCFIEFNGTFLKSQFEGSEARLILRSLSRHSRRAQDNIEAKAAGLALEMMTVDRPERKFGRAVVWATARVA